MQTGTEPQAGRGLLASLRKLATTLVAIVATRLEILISEFELEKLRLARMLVLGVAAVFFAAMALVFLSLLVLILFWDEHRLAALGGISAVYALLAAGAVSWLRHDMRQKSRLFSVSLGELRKDELELETG
jgi:uncharacterized membrane protein YqjE